MTTGHGLTVENGTIPAEVATDTTDGEEVGVEVNHLEEGHIEMTGVGILEGIDVVTQILGQMGVATAGTLVVGGMKMSSKGCRL